MLFTMDQLLWAKVKRYVADHSTHNRSITQAREQTEYAFEHITKMFCNSIVKHCHDWIDHFLTTDAAEDLQQCGTLAGVIKHLPLLKATNNTQGHTLTLMKNNNNTQSTHICPSPPPSAASNIITTRTLRKRH